jgi:ATP-dependent DNA helicase RecG
MTKMELLEIVANGENSIIEFKRDDLRPEQLAREIVAFANAYGGKIILGVEDDGVISGLQHNNTEEWVVNIFNDKVHPQLIPCYEEIKIDDGKRVGVIHVPQGELKPYVARHHDDESIYIRTGSRVKKGSRETQMRLFESGGMLHIEEIAVSGTDLESLDYSRLEYYLKEVLNEETIPDRESELIDLLVGKGIMRENALGVPVCTVAGIICFGLKPRRWIPQAGLRVMSFKGKEMEYQALLDIVLDVPLVGRWQKTKNEKILVDNGLVEKFLELFEPFITQEAADIDEHFRREKTWFYPREAVRELAINALAHRDWSRTVDIEVTNYCDRLEVISPGAFQNSMNIEKMIAGHRSHRNQLIADILRDYGYIDGRGMGVRTKVIPSMRSLNKTDPLFEATEDYVKTILPRKKADPD